MKNIFLLTTLSLGFLSVSQVQASCKCSMGTHDGSAIYALLPWSDEYGLIDWEVSVYVQEGSTCEDRSGTLLGDQDTTISDEITIYYYDELSEEFVLLDPWQGNITLFGCHDVQDSIIIH